MYCSLLEVDINVTCLSSYPTLTNGLVFFTLFGYVQTVCNETGSKIHVDIDKEK